MSAPCSADDPRTRLLITVDTESTMAGLRPLDPDVMVYGRLDGGTYGIERIMDCCEARGFRATFFVSTLEALHHGEAHVARMCAACLDRGHDVQLHVHPNWWKANFERKRLTDYPFDEQLEVIAEAIAAYRRACGTNPIAHRAGGLLANATTFRVLQHFGIPIDASVAPGYHAYRLGAPPPNVPRRLRGITEVPVTRFAQFRLGPWAPGRTFDVNADSLAELRFVVDRAAAEGVTAVSLLLHSFSFVGRNQDSTRFRPLHPVVRRFERFLDHVASRGDVAVVTTRELAAELAARPELLDAPDFAPTVGLARTYRRSWEHFGASWKNKALALGLPALAIAAAAGLVGALRWLLP